MDRAHEPSRVVRSDRQNRHIERAQTRADSAELGMKCRPLIQSAPLQQPIARWPVLPKIPDNRRDEKKERGPERDMPRFLCYGTSENLVDEETGAEILRAPLPKIHGDLTLLTQVFQNLLGNALKFRGEARPTIEISVSPQGRECHCR